MISLHMHINIFIFTNKQSRQQQCCKVQFNDQINLEKIVLYNLPLNLPGYQTYSYNLDFLLEQKIIFSISTYFSLAMSVAWMPEVSLIVIATEFYTHTAYQILQFYLSHVSSLVHNINILTRQSSLPLFFLLPASNVVQSCGFMLCNT